MKLPIPSDWDNTSWQCVQIQWPDSPVWFAILNGLIAGLARGRLWDERDGSILDVQAIGREIWTRSIPFIGCGDEPITPPPAPEEITQVIGGGGICWEELMPCLDISSLIKLEEGHLWVMDGCCQWVDKGAIADFVEETLGDTPGDQFDPEIPYSGCGAATAIVDIIYAVAMLFWGATNESPLNYISSVKTAAAPMELKSKYIVEGIAAAIALKTAGTEEESVFDDLSKQSILCRLSRTLTADTGALSQANIDAINRAFEQNLEFESLLFKTAANAIGRSQLSNIAMAGSLDQEQDCACPELVPPTMPPNDGGPWWTGRVVKTAGDGVFAITEMSPNMRKIKVRWMVDAPGQATTDAQAAMQMITPANITSLTVKLTGDYPVANWRNLPYDRWNDPHIPSLQNVSSETPTLGEHTAAGSTWVITWSTPGLPTYYEAGATNTFRFLPQDTTPLGATCEWEMEILAWS